MREEANSGAKGVVGRAGETDDRRKIVANDGEVKAASFFLFASCLRATGCPDDGTREILVSRRDAARKNVDAKNVSFCWELRKN